MNALLRQVPNILSALRLVAAPFTAVLVAQRSDVAALCVFGVAGLSDALDGFLAKRYSLTSRFGAWLDPAADKLLMLLSFIALTAIGAVPLWVAALVIGRDAAIVIGIAAAWLMEAPLRIAPLIVGKASTVAQVAYIVLVLLLLALGVSFPLLVSAGNIVVGFFTLWSFFAYGLVWLQAVAAGRRAV